jgi:hypothetical protein
MLIALSLLFAQATVPGPTILPGASQEFHESALAVQELLDKEDFQGAQVALNVLPKRALTIHWDDSEVPAEGRGALEEARDRAVLSWMRYVPDVKIDFGPKDKAALVISFEDKLPDDPATGMPAGAVHLFSGEPNGFRLETVIALNRGRPAQAALPPDVHNEVVYAIGAYLGLAKTPFFGSAMGRNDLAFQRYAAVAPIEGLIARQNLQAIDLMQKAIDKKTRMIPSKPTAVYEPPVFEAGPVAQGTILPFSIQIANNGRGPLHYLVQPDCGCLTAQGGPPIDEGTAGIIRAQIDTTEFVGDLRKRLIVLSNDPEQPYREIQVNVKVTPYFRLISPEGPVMVMPDGGGTREVYLVLSEGAKLTPQEVRLDGLEGAVKYEKWEGMLADPEMGEEKPLPRKGYKFTIRLEDKVPPGRGSATLSIRTDNERFPMLRYFMMAQKGIVALPDQLYLGEIKRAPQTFHFMVSRPNSDFKITKVESTSPHFTFRHEPVRGQWEHRIFVQFDGKYDFGQLGDTIRIHTDDPKQPVIEVPVSAVVR